MSPTPPHSVPGSQTLASCHPFSPKESRVAEIRVCGAALDLTVKPVFLFPWKGRVSSVPAAFWSPGKYDYLSPCWKRQIVCKPNGGGPS